MNPVLIRCLLFMLLCGLLSPLPAQEAGEAVRLQGTIAEDTYAAGGRVDSQASVEGDVVVAGGHVTIDRHVSGDVMAAGGVVAVHAVIGDDLRVAGGDITLGGAVAGDAIAAGGNVTLAPDGKIGERAWFAGGRIDVAGEVGGELRAAGGRIVIAGTVHGNVDLAGRTISILDGAVIEGNLVYRSPREAEIAGGAQIRGTVSYEPVERPVLSVVMAAAGAGIVLFLSLILTGSALFLFFPDFMDRALATIHAEPWKCLGLGLAVFAATPVVVSVLFMTVIGWLPAVIIGTLYLLLLLAGFLSGAFYVGRRGAARLGRDGVSRAWQIGSFVVALVVLMLLGLIPLLGQLLLFVLALLGMGTLVLGLYRIYVYEIP